jgi:hypothetical protein
MAEDDPVRIIRHSVIPDAGSFEVRWPGGHKFFYWDDIAGRRLQPDALTQDQALEAARALARTERDKLEHTCPNCDGTGWVCEEHPDQPWEGLHACSCGAAGAPCPHCNRTDDGEPPRMPSGFEPDQG